ncbi:hypothetical protein ThrDRAFT_04460 [Frankia casuarinae]|nr:hypothetical protein CcI6DRAFT_04682 [Frankia sp. CcI6]EYT89918.1 hypothetical protein ThrDRAFT_04460 [Frankia casuarinae]KDA40901.1 hypothetical protein BMG523Draft_04286 [Frankia sp. BMG5.23]KFB02668.1 hypothetical protein ALLO2DRAFT_04584 [Frankia sp. Allo2]OAA18491.1 hypothetical protein AAY23_112612 [Frankia casuarinae]
MGLHLSQIDEADELLTNEPLALLIGMVLDSGYRKDGVESVLQASAGGLRGVLSCQSFPMPRSSGG